MIRRLKQSSNYNKDIKKAEIVHLYWDKSPGSLSNSDTALIKLKSAKSTKPRLTMQVMKTPFISHAQT